MASLNENVARGPVPDDRLPLRVLKPPTSDGAQVARAVARYAGAASIVAVGIVHAQQYYGAYFSYVPVIGTLFLLSFIGAGVVGVGLLAPLGRLGGRFGDLLLALAALGGIGIAVGSLVSLLVSEYTPLFGFMESGYRLAVVLAIVFDVLATVFLGAFVLMVMRARRQPRTPR